MANLFYGPFKDSFTLQETLTSALDDLVEGFTVNVMPVERHDAEEGWQLEPGQFLTTIRHDEIEGGQWRGIVSGAPNTTLLVDEGIGFRHYTGALKPSGKEGIIPPPGVNVEDVDPYFTGVQSFARGLSAAFFQFGTQPKDDVRNRNINQILTGQHQTVSGQAPKEYRGVGGTDLGAMASQTGWYSREQATPQRIRAESESYLLTRVEGSPAEARAGLEKQLQLPYLDRDMPVGPEQEGWWKLMKGSVLGEEGTQKLVTLGTAGERWAGPEGEVMGAAITQDPFKRKHVAGWRPAPEIWTFNRKQGRMAPLEAPGYYEEQTIVEKAGDEPTKGLRLQAVVPMTALPMQTGMAQLNLPKGLRDPLEEKGQALYTADTAAKRVYLQEGTIKSIAEGGLSVKEDLIGRSLKPGRNVAFGAWGTGEDTRPLSFQASQQQQTITGYTLHISPEEMENENRKKNIQRYVDELAGRGISVAYSTDATEVPYITADVKSLSEMAPKGDASKQQIDQPAILANLDRYYRVRREGQKSLPYDYMLADPKSYEATMWSSLKAMPTTGKDNLYDFVRTLFPEAAERISTYQEELGGDRPSRRGLGAAVLADQSGTGAGFLKAAALRAYQHDKPASEIDVRRNIDLMNRFKVGRIGGEVPVQQFQPEGKEAFTKWSIEALMEPTIEGEPGMSREAAEARVKEEYRWTHRGKGVYDLRVNMDEAIYTPMLQNFVSEQVGLGSTQGDEPMSLEAQGFPGMAEFLRGNKEKIFRSTPAAQAMRNVQIGYLNTQAGTMPDPTQSIIVGEGGINPEDVIGIQKGMEGMNDYERLRYLGQEINKLAGEPEDAPLKPIHFQSTQTTLPNPLDLATMETSEMEILDSLEIRPTTGSYLSTRALPMYMQHATAASLGQEAPGLRRDALDFQAQYLKSDLLTKPRGGAFTHASLSGLVPPSEELISPLLEERMYWNMGGRGRARGSMDWNSYIQTMQGAAGVANRAPTTAYGGEYGPGAIQMKRIRTSTGGTSNNWIYQAMSKAWERAGLAQPELIVSVQETASQIDADKDPRIFIPLMFADKNKWRRYPGKGDEYDEWIARVKEQTSADQQIAAMRTYYGEDTFMQQNPMWEQIQDFFGGKGGPKSTATTDVTGLSEATESVLNRKTGSGKVYNLYRRRGWAAAAALGAPDVFTAGAMDVTGTKEYSQAVDAAYVQKFYDSIMGSSGFLVGGEGNVIFGSHTEKDPPIGTYTKGRLWEPSGGNIRTLTQQMGKWLGDQEGMSSMGMAGLLMDIPTWKPGGMSDEEFGFMLQKEQRSIAGELEPLMKEGGIPLNKKIDELVAANRFSERSIGVNALLTRATEYGNLNNEAALIAATEHATMNLGLYGEEMEWGDVQKEFEGGSMAYDFLLGRKGTGTYKTKPNIAGMHEWFRERGSEDTALARQFHWSWGAPVGYEAPWEGPPGTTDIETKAMRKSFYALEQETRNPWYRVDAIATQIEEARGGRKVRPSELPYRGPYTGPKDAGVIGGQAHELISDYLKDQGVVTEMPVPGSPGMTGGIVDVPFYEHEGQTGILDIKTGTMSPERALGQLSQYSRFVDTDRVAHVASISRADIAKIKSEEVARARGMTPRAALPTRGAAYGKEYLDDPDIDAAALLQKQLPVGTVFYGETTGYEILSQSPKSEAKGLAREVRQFDLESGEDLNPHWMDEQGVLADLARTERIEYPEGIETRSRTEQADIRMNIGRRLWQKAQENLTTFNASLLTPESVERDLLGIAEHERIDIEEPVPPIGRIPPSRQITATSAVAPRAVTPITTPASQVTATSPTSPGPTGSRRGKDEWFPIQLEDEEGNLTGVRARFGATTNLDRNLIDTIEAIEGGGSAGGGRQFISRKAPENLHILQGKFDQLEGMLNEIAIPTGTGKGWSQMASGTIMEVFENLPAEIAKALPEKYSAIAGFDVKNLGEALMTLQDAGVPVGSFLKDSKVGETLTRFNQIQKLSKQLSGNLGFLSGVDPHEQALIDAIGGTPGKVGDFDVAGAKDYGLMAGTFEVMQSLTSMAKPGEVMSQEQMVIHDTATKQIDAAAQATRDFIETMKPFEEVMTASGKQVKVTSENLNTFADTIADRLGAEVAETGDPGSLKSLVALVGKREEMATAAAAVAEQAGVGAPVGGRLTEAQVKQARAAAYASGEAAEIAAVDTYEQAEMDVNAMLAGEGAPSPVDARGDVGFQIGKLGRRMLGGFGLMYMRSIANIATGGARMGYEGGMEQRAAIEGAIGARFGGMAPLMAPEEEYARAEAAYGGLGWAGLRQLQAEGMRAGGGAIMGAGGAALGAGAFAGWVGTMAPGTVMAAPWLAPAVAGIAAVGTLGLTAYGAAQEPELSGVQLAQRQYNLDTFRDENVQPSGIGAVLSGEYAKYNKAMSGLNFAFDTSPGRLGQLWAQVTGDDTALGVMEKTEAIMTEIRVGLEGSDLGVMEFLRSTGKYSEEEVRHYTSLYSNWKVADYPTIPVPALSEAIALQSQYGLRLTEGEGDTFEQFAMGLSQGIPYEPIGLMVGYTPSMSYEQIQQRAAAAIEGQLERGGLTADEIARLQRGGTRYEQLGIYAPSFPQERIVSEERVSTFRKPGEEWKSHFEKQIALEEERARRLEYTQEDYLFDLAAPPEMQFQLMAQQARIAETMTGVGLTYEFPKIEDFQGDITPEEYARRYREEYPKELRSAAIEQWKSAAGALGIFEAPARFDIGAPATTGEILQATTDMQYGGGIEQMLLEAGLGGREAQAWGQVFGQELPEGTSSMYKGMMQFSPLAWGQWAQTPAVAQAMKSFDFDSMFVTGEGGIDIPMSTLFHTDVTSEGKLTGMPWGTSSLGLPSGRTSAETADIIWGAGGWQDSGYASAMVEGGQWGAQIWQMKQQAGYQGQQAGFQQRRLALQREYTPQMWDIQDQQRDLGYAQQEWQFDFQERQIEMQDRFWQQNFGLQQQQSQKQRQWTREDYGYQDQMRSMQWNWRVEDFGEESRFMTGRDRRIAERQMRRDVIMHGLEGDQIDRQRARQEEMWGLEDKRYDIQRQQHEESVAMQEEQLAKSRQFFEERKALEQELTALQRELWEKNMVISEEAAAAASGLAAAQMDVAEKMEAFQQYVQGTNTDLSLLNKDSMEPFLELIKLLDPAFAALFETALSGLDAIANIDESDPNKDPYFKPGDSSKKWTCDYCGAVNTGGDECARCGTPRPKGTYQRGGKLSKGVHWVGETGPEKIVVGGGGEGYVVPSYRLNPWEKEQMFFGDGAGGQVVHMILNVGGYQLAELVTDIVDKEIDV